jgi:hypothetical protein
MGEKDLMMDSNFLQSLKRQNSHLSANLVDKNSEDGPETSCNQEVAGLKLGFSADG